MADENEQTHIMLNNVRASFAHLFRPPVIDGETGKCGSQLMLDPEEHADELEELNEEIRRVGRANFERRLPAEKICLRAGEDKGREEYDGWMILSANCKEGSRPVVVDAVDPEKIIDDESRNPIYSGCRVNAKVRIWPQKNQWGKRINCSLIAIQFARDDEPLDSGTVTEGDAVKGFTATKKGKKSGGGGGGEDW